MVDSVILLFESTETSFTTNGLGPLSDAISCAVIEERNGEFELEMEYPINGIHYDEISLRRIILAKSNPYSSPQPFRIYNITKPISGIVTINAEHISYDLTGYPVSPFTADNITHAFERMRSNIITNCPFSFWTDKTTKATMTTTVPYSVRSLLGGMNGSFLDVYGSAEYEFDRFIVKLHNNRGTNRGVSIRYGKNLTDLKQDENCSNVYTGVYPFWYYEEKGLVELPEKYINCEGTYNFVRILPLDLSDKFQDKPTETQLRTQAESYMKKNNIGIPKVSLTVSFISLAQSSEYYKIALLETVRLCDTVNVEFPELGVSATAKCISTTYNVLTDKYDKIELGDAKTTLASKIVDQNDSIQDAMDTTRSSLEKAIEHATLLITGGLGGYVILHSSTGGKQPDEILIMDTPDIETAREVWRWNKGGLGFSNNGYEGPFRTAITQDGQIVADFITAGVFDGAIIKAGSIIGDMLSIEYRNSVKEYADSIGEDVYKECVSLIENTANSIRLLVKSVEEYNMHNYCLDPWFNNGFEGNWYTSVADNTIVTYLSNQSARINKTSSTNAYIRYRLGVMEAGTYRIRYKAATTSAATSTARIQCTAMGTTKTTTAGQLKSNEWTTFEFEVTLEESSSVRYIYFYATIQNAPVYITEIEVLGHLLEYTKAQLKLTSDAITAEVERATAAEGTLGSRITQTANSITAEVTRAKGVEEELKASIKLNADNITSTVKKGDFESYLKQYYNSVIVAFNNSSNYVEITAGQIGVYDGSKTNNGLRATFNQVGMHFWEDGIDIGMIGPSRRPGYETTDKCLIFGLEPKGKYMAFAQRTSTDDIYHLMMGFTRAGTLYNSYGVQLGCNMYMNGNNIYEANNINSVANGYSTVGGKQVQIVTDINVDDDGNLTWETGTFNVRSGLITAVPEESKDLED